MNVPDRLGEEHVSIALGAWLATSRK